MFSRLPAPIKNSYWSVTGAFLLLALIPTVWPALDLWAASPFAPLSPRLSSVDWWWVEAINAYIPAVFRACLALAFVGWLVALSSSKWNQWRLPLAFIVTAGILGPGAVVNLVFKDNWQRARPYQVENFGGTLKFTRAAVMTDQCDNNCSFVSGHVACGAFLISIGLVHRRKRGVWAIAGASAGLLIGFARMSAAGHWLSDVLWAFPITLLTSWLVWKGLSTISRTRAAS
jgi:lipid A 4'-phosphatase